MTQKTILAFGASNSKNSINKKLAEYAASRFENARTIILDLNDFEMPIYSIDREKENGFPEKAIQFKAYLKDADVIVISFAEHNGAYTAAFKNIFDWISRIEKNVWYDKPMLLLSTSPGARGASIVLELAFNKFKRMNSNLIAAFSLPNFKENFSEDDGIIEPPLAAKLDEQIALVRNKLSEVKS
jgi:NAD(P)H-dependent FMN reductase